MEERKQVVIDLQCEAGAVSCEPSIKYRMEERETQEMTTDERFLAFVKELNVLSVKYGVLIRSIGGVEVLNDEDFRHLSRVKYSQDPDSGDLMFEPFYKA